MEHFPYSSICYSKLANLCAPRCITRNHVSMFSPLIGQIFVGQEQEKSENRVLCSGLQHISVQASLEPWQIRNLFIAVVITGYWLIYMYLNSPSIKHLRKAG